MARRTHPGDAQRLAAVRRKAVVAQHGDPVRPAVLAHSLAVVVRRRIVVDAGHGHVHRPAVKAPVPVRDGVGKAVAAVKVGLRRVGHHAAGEGNRAVARTAHRVHGQCIAVEITVVSQDTDRHRGILVGTVVVVHGLRRHIGDGVGHDDRARVGLHAVHSGLVGQDSPGGQAAGGAHGNGDEPGLFLADVAQVPDVVPSAGRRRCRLIGHVAVVRFGEHDVGGGRSAGVGDADGIGEERIRLHLFGRGGLADVEQFA